MPLVISNNVRLQGPQRRRAGSGNIPSAVWRHKSRWGFHCISSGWYLLENAVGRATVGLGIGFRSPYPFYTHDKSRGNPRVIPIPAIYLKTQKISTQIPHTLRLFCRLVCRPILSVYLVCRPYCWVLSHCVIYENYNTDSPVRIHYYLHTHNVNFRFREMLRNWFTATVDIIVIIYAYLFSSSFRNINSFTVSRFWVTVRVIIALLYTVSKRSI